ncbi:MAG: HDOD domain-containing protein, partial [Desulfobacterales bacterium]
MESASSSAQRINLSDLKKRLFRGLDNLLPLPQVVLKAQSLMLDPNSTFDDLADIIETDQEITLKILKVANSAYYSLKTDVSSVRQACVMLGLSVIGEIIMAAGTSNPFSKALEAYSMNPKGLWQHSLAVAFGSRKIANAVKPKVANEAFLSGLFHDVGKIILDEQIFSRNLSFKKYLGDDQNTHFKVEKQILGFD